MTKSDKNNCKLSDFELDQLKEVINIGASYASTALSQLVNKTVIISVPEVHIDKIENVSKIIGNEDKVVTAILLKVFGEAPGALVYLFPHNVGTNEFIRLITKDEDSKKTLDEYDISVLKEVGNILSGAALGAFSKFLNINFLHSVSEALTDMVGSVINSFMAEIGVKFNTILLFKVTFDIKEKEGVSPEFYFFVDPAASERIINTLNKKK